MAPHPVQRSRQGEAGIVQEESVQHLISCRVACRVKWEKCRGRVDMPPLCSAVWPVLTLLPNPNCVLLPDPALYSLCTFPPCTVDSPLPPTIDARCGVRAHAPLHSHCPGTKASFLLILPPKRTPFTPFTYCHHVQLLGLVTLVRGAAGGGVAKQSVNACPRNLVQSGTKPD